MITERMLKGHELFQSMTPEEVDQISRHCSIRRCQPFDVVFREGDRATHLFIVVEGLVYLRLASKSSDVGLIAARLEKGDLCGLSPLLGADTYTLSAQCARPTELLAVEAKPLRELLLQNSLMGMTVMTGVASAYFRRYVEVIRHLEGVITQLPLIQ